MKVSNGTVTLDLRRATIRDGFRREAIVQRLTQIDGKREREVSYRLFGRVCTQATAVEGLAFALPTDDDADAALRAAWERWIDAIDESLEDQILVALSELIRPTTVATGPQPLTEGAQKNS